MNLRTIAIFCCLTLTACGQNYTPQQNQITQKIENDMNLSEISNHNVRNAIQALQDNDLKTWYSYFADTVTFTDDGNTMDFKSFFDNAFEKKEKFLDLNKIENNGKDIYGNFYAGTWGTFNVYFKFHEGKNGKFNRLDIGQVSKMK